jgi:hypothetical protein
MEVPAAVRTQAQWALAMNREGFQGATDTGWARAR